MSSLGPGQGHNYTAFNVHPMIRKQIDVNSSCKTSSVMRTVVLQRSVMAKPTKRKVSDANSRYGVLQTVGTVTNRGTKRPLQLLLLSRVEGVERVCQL